MDRAEFLNSITLLPIGGTRWREFRVETGHMRDSDRLVVCPMPPYHKMGNILVDIQDHNHMIQILTYGRKTYHGARRYKDALERVIEILDELQVEGL